MSHFDLTSTLRVIRRQLAAACIVFGALGAQATLAQAPAEIIELARALKNNPDLIYEYVYNNIETLPQYGSVKGPLGALLDGKGTSFDQAELMVALLQQSGYAASYQIGRIQLTAAQLTAWLGTDTTLGSVNQTLNNGGFPQTTNAPVGVVTGAQVNWAWVVVNIGGTNYLFDPSTKVYQRQSGLGVSTLASAMNYSQGVFLNRAESGATITPTSIIGLNRSNIRSDLAQASSDLVQYIRTSAPAASTADIIGGKRIVPLTIGLQQRSQTLSYVIGGTVTSHATIPSAYRTILTLRLGYLQSGFQPLTNAITFNSSDIYGHRVVVSLNASRVPSILIDGVNQIAGSAAPPSNLPVTIRASINHPYPSTFANVTNSDSMKVPSLANSVHVVGTSWGGVSRSMIEKHRKLLQENIELYPGNPTAEPVLGESLAMIGYYWLAETTQQRAIAEQLSGTTIVEHHNVGIVSTKASAGASGPYVDFPLGTFRVTQRTARPNSTGQTPIESTAFICIAMFGSIAESGILEQTQPGNVAASTVKLVDTTVQAGGQVFDINNTSTGGTAAYYTSTIRPVLATTYAPADLSRIDAIVSAGRRVVAPANGAITIDLYTGAGYFDISQNSGSFGAIITGGLFGGVPASNIPTAQVPANTDFSVQAALPQSPVISNPQGSQGNAGGNFGITPTSAEPINLVTGDYILTATDLVVGSQAMPYGLGFQRYYDSGTRMRKGPVGYGWTHAYSITAKPDSDAFAGLATNSPINGAVSIAVTLITLDLLNTGTTTSKPLDRIVVSSVVFRWLMDQFNSNVAAVVQPGYVEHFTKLADGTFNPPAGSGATVTLAGGTYTYVAKDQVTLSFNTDGNVVTRTDPRGVTLTLAYSGSPALLSSVSNNLGRTITFNYTSGLLTQVLDGTGRSVGYSYDAAGNLETATDPMGFVTRYIYDRPGRLTQIFYPSRPGNAFVTNTYDSLGRVNTQSDANNAPWSYFFAGTRSEEVNPTGMRRVLYSTTLGKTRVEIQDLGGLNLTTTNSHDGLGRVVLTALPEGNSVGYTYDIRSNVLTTTQTPKVGPLSAVTTTIAYDPTFNKPTTITGPAPRSLKTTFLYDGATGSLLSTVADAGAPPHFNATSTFSYTAVGLIDRSIDPMGVATQFTYDSFGNQTSVVRDVGAGRLNQTTVAGYDAVGNVTSVTDPRGLTTSNTYDAARRLRTSTSPGTLAAPNGILTTLSYDEDGRLLQTQDSANSAVLRTTSSAYTVSGKLASSTDANGNSIEFRYNQMDLLASVVDPVGRTTRYGYDALSRRVAVFNDAIQSAALVQQSYTPNGKLDRLTDAFGNFTDYTYDGLDRLSATTYPGGSTEILTYDNDNNIISRQTRAGQTILFAYDTLNRLVTKTLPPPWAPVSYTYDLMGRPLTVSDTSASMTAVAPPGGVTTRFTTSYSYDNLNRPINVTWDPAPAQTAPSTGANVTFTHGYTKANQRSTMASNDNSWLFYPAATPGTTTYASNALNQYTAITGVSPNPSYDANGNLTGDGTYTLGYDGENRLVSASGGGNTASYAYDARGRRKLRTVNGTTIAFVTGADNREVLEYDGSSGQVLRWYAYGLGPNAVLNRMDVPGGTRETPIADLQGSIIGSLNSAGTLTKTQYATYGGNAGTAPAPFGYTGQRRDAETALYYYRARMYHTAWGRFIQVDPIGYGDGVNLYAYVGNDPLNMVDPEGEVGQILIGAAAGFAVELAFQAVAGEFSGSKLFISTATGALTGGVSVASNLIASAAVRTTAVYGAQAIVGAGGGALKAYVDGKGLGEAAIAGAIGGVVGRKVAVLTQARFGETAGIAAQAAFSAESKVVSNVVQSIFKAANDYFGVGGAAAGDFSNLNSAQNGTPSFGGRK